MNKCAIHKHKILTFMVFPVVGPLPPHWALHFDPLCALPLAPLCVHPHYPAQLLPLSTLPPHSLHPPHVALVIVHAG